MAKKTPAGFGALVAQAQAAEAKSPSPTPAPAHAAPPESSQVKYKALTYRVTPDTWRRLQELRVELDMPVTDLITEGLNLLLTQRGLRKLK